MPPRQGFAVQPGGQLAGWREGFVPVRPSKGVVIKAAWSWGAGDQVVAGVAPAEACKVFGKLGDALGSYRPDIELIWWFNYDTLKDISGAAEVFGQDIWELMRRHDKLFVTSNLSERHNFECVVGDARVEIILPDTNGDYVPGIRAAQAEEDDAVLLLGRVNLKINGHGAPVKVESFSAAVEGDTLDSLRHEGFDDNDFSQLDIPPCAASQYGTGLAGRCPVRRPQLRRRCPSA